MHPEMTFETEKEQSFWAVLMLVQLYTQTPYASALQRADAVVEEMRKRDPRHQSADE